LIFGQVGAGFFHNKHDAHETVIDLDHTVLVAHGEHCKICSVDWVHQFIASVFQFEEVEQVHNIHNSTLYYSLISSSQLLTKDRAPPIGA
jgi:hypothetical protein